MTKVYRTLRVAPSGEGSAARAASSTLPGCWDGGAMEAILGADDLHAEMADRTRPRPARPPCSCRA